MANSDMPVPELFVYGRLVLPGGKVVPGRLGIVRHRIVEVATGRAAQTHVGDTPCLSATYVLPGFIDVQINGLRGVDLVETPDGLQSLARDLPAFGVTSFLPTWVSSGPDVYPKAVAAFQRFERLRSGARCRPARCRSAFMRKDRTSTKAVRAPTTARQWPRARRTQSP